MNKEKFTQSKAITAFTAATALVADAAVNGLAIDTQFFNSLIIPLSIDLTAGEIASIGFEQSDDSGVADPWAATLEDTDLYYPDDFPLDTVSEFIINVASVAKKRYVRCVVTGGALAAGTIDAAIGLLQDSIRKPLEVESSVIANADIHSQGDTGDASSTYPKRPVV